MTYQLIGIDNFELYESFELLSRCKKLCGGSAIVSDSRFQVKL